MESGQVIFVSANQGMIVVRHSGGFAVVELLGGEGEFERGDNVQGNWLALGGEPIFKNKTRYSAYFQGDWATQSQAIRIARNTGGG